MPWLVVGLGNPGPKYAGTRHNAGFLVVEELARRSGESFRTKFHGLFARCRVGHEDAILLQPMTYMNRSGISLGEAAAFYKTPPERVVVIHDELDLDFGDLRLKVGGGHGGHNGLRSILSHYHREFIRLRFGVGRPRHGDVTDHVLGGFSSDERVLLDSTVDRAANWVEGVLRDGPDAAMNAFHGKAGQA